MKIEQHKIKIRDLFEGFADNGDKGVVAYGGKLDVRPPYQREFVYKDEQRNSVIRSVKKGYPLNTMYWVKRPLSGPGQPATGAVYEVLDGQQRTLSICQYVDRQFSVDEHYFNTSQPETDESKRLLDYELTVYICEGTDEEKIEWFQIINIAGVKLTDQELLNAVYTGPWLADAKRFFSKRNCSAYQLGSKYMKGSPERQDYLETVLKWISNGDVTGYMGKHQLDPDAAELKSYFEAVIAWVRAVFPKYREKMADVAWGPLYNTYKDREYDAAELELEVSRLWKDPDVTSHAGIFRYVLAAPGSERLVAERWLSIRAFDDATKEAAYEIQKGLCPAKGCTGGGRKFELSEMEADHVTPWHLGGRTVLSNCRMLCKGCNRRKSGV